MNFLINYDYPGNIRELKNITERMIALSKDGIVTVNEILMPIGNNVGKKFIGNGDIKTLKSARSNFEYNFISEAIKENNGNIAKTAEQLKISTRQLWNKINQYKIEWKNRE